MIFVFGKIYFNAVYLDDKGAAWASLRIDCCHNTSEYCLHLTYGVRKELRLNISKQSYSRQY